LVVQILLKLNRPDLAEKEVAAMQKMNEFAAPTQLAAAWTNVALGGDRIKEAVSIYQDLMDKYGPSPLLLNNIAVALMNQKKYQDAEAPLLQAIERVRQVLEITVPRFQISYIRLYFRTPSFLKFW
jgi:coatomer subunit epsilon